MLITLVLSVPQKSNSLCSEHVPRPQESEYHRTPANQAKKRQKFQNSEFSLFVCLLWNMYEYCYFASLNSKILKYRGIKKKTYTF